MPAHAWVSLASAGLTATVLALNRSCKSPSFRPGRGQARRDLLGLAAWAGLGDSKRFPSFLLTSVISEQEPEGHFLLL